MKKKIKKSIQWHTFEHNRDTNQLNMDESDENKIIIKIVRFYRIYS